MDTGCIYRITNLINGKHYIGQTIDFQRRKNQHLNRPEKQVINRALEKYGAENFEFEVIHDDIPVEGLDKWELYYINEIYNTYKGHGYNIHIGGNVFRGENSTNALDIPTKEINSLVGYFLDNDVNFLQLEDKFDIHRGQIARILKGSHYLSYKINYDKFDKKDIQDKYYQVSNNIGIFSSNSITIEDAKQIIECKKEGFSNQKVSDKLGFGSDLVGSVVRGEHWTTNYLDFDEFNLTYIDLLNNYSNHDNAYNINFENTLEVIKLRLLGYSKNRIYKKVDLGHGSISQIISSSTDKNHPIIDIMKDKFDYELFLGFTKTLTYYKALGITLWDVIRTKKLLSLINQKNIKKVSEVIDKSWHFVDKIAKGENSLLNYINTRNRLNLEVRKLIKNIQDLTKDEFISTLD